MIEIKSEDLNLPPLGLPEAHLSFSIENGELKIFDKTRKKYILLTPEEYIRQTFVDWLINFLNYPASHISNEVFIRLNDTKKRCDTIVYDEFGKPWMIVEYKRPEIRLGEEVINQILAYNLVLEARYITVSNGFECLCYEVDYKDIKLNNLSRLPPYPSF